MRPLLRQALIFLACLLLAATAQAETERVINGKDIRALREIHQRNLEGDEAIAVYRWYLLNFSNSPLAEIAWSRLRSLGGLQGDWKRSRALKGDLPQIERSWKLHQRALMRTLTDVSIASIPVFSKSKTAKKKVTPHADVITGVGWLFDSAHTHLGLQGSLPWTSLAILIGRGDQVYGQGALRLSYPTTVQPFMEGTLDTELRLGTYGGVRIPLREGLALELAGGLAPLEEQLTPHARLSLATRLF